MNNKSVEQHQIRRLACELIARESLRKQIAFEVVLLLKNM